MRRPMAPRPTSRLQEKIEHAFEPFNPVFGLSPGPPGADVSVTVSPFVRHKRRRIRAEVENGNTVAFVYLGGCSQDSSLGELGKDCMAFDPPLIR